MPLADTIGAATTALPHDRLWHQFDRAPSGCWEWRGNKTTQGYGRVTIRRRQHSAHRLMWEWHNGEPVPDGLVVRHQCDNPPCINPHHLLVGTHADNIADKVRRGRQARGEMLPQTKFTQEQRREVHAKFIKDFAPAISGHKWRSNVRELAQEYGVSEHYIYNILAGRGLR